MKLVSALMIASASSLALPAVAAPALPTPPLPFEASMLAPRDGTPLPRGHVVLRVLSTGRALGDAQPATAVDGALVDNVAESDCSSVCEETITIDAVPAGESLALSIAGGRFDALVWPLADRTDTTAPTFGVGRVKDLAQRFTNVQQNATEPSFPGFVVEFTVPAATDDFGVSAYRVTESSGQTVAMLRGDGDDDKLRVSAGLFNATTHTDCFNVTAIDFAGNETTFPESACFELERPILACACLTPRAGAPIAFLGSLVGVGLVLGRRRRA